MATDRGIPAVPRGLDRTLTNYLQSLQSIVLRLSGMVRGSDESRAVRVSDGSVSTGTATASIGQGAILTQHIADNAITSAKITDGAVTDAKLSASSVTGRALAAGAVGTMALAGMCITAEKIADGVLPTVVDGEAVDGEEVLIPGKWLSKPGIMLSSVSQAQTTTGAFGVTGLQEILDVDGNGTGEWKFTAAGSFAWLALGNANEQ